MKRVVITGLGTVTGAGESALSLWDAVKAGRSSIGVIEFDGPEGPWKTMGARVSDFEPEKYVMQRKSLKVMARDIQLAVAGASLAMKDAALTGSVYDHDRFGVIMGSGVLNHELDELAYSVQNSIDDDQKLDLKKFGSSGLSSLFPLWLLKYLPNMPACHISILFDLRGINNTITTGASGGMQAIGEAFRVIQRGDADLMLAGGAESKVNPVGLSEYKILGAFSGEIPAEPGKSYRLFDEKARGFIAGEGAGFLVLEEFEHAKKRGAKIYAEVAGFGSSCREGHALAMKAALKDAGIPSSRISYLQASGIGIASEDCLEEKAIREVFGAGTEKVWISASKPVTGFAGFSAGALDLAVSTMALGEGTVPPMMNFSRSGSAAGWRVADRAVSGEKLDYVMTNAFGFNGQTACIVTRAAEGAGR